MTLNLLGLILELSPAQYPWGSPNLDEALVEYETLSRYTCIVGHHSQQGNWLEDIWRALECLLNIVLSENPSSEQPKAALPHRLNTRMREKSEFLEIR